MLIANSKVDLCDGAMSLSDKAAEATDKANRSGKASDHYTAMHVHSSAADVHDAAADDREGEASTAHSVMATSHRAQANRHAESRDYIRANDSEDEADDSDDQSPETAVQNHNPNRRMKMPNRQLITNAEAERELAYWRTQNIGGKAYDQIVRKIRIRQGVVANCACSDDSVIPPTMSEVLGIAPPTSNTMPIPGELRYDGVSSDPSVYIAPTINHAFAANFNGPSFAGHTGRNMQGVDKGYAFRSGKSAGDYRSIPGFNYPDGDSGMYVESGVRDVAPLTSGRPRVEPSIPPRSRDDGGNVGSYPLQGTIGDLGSADSAGDEQDDDDARAGRSGDASRTRGSRSGRGKPSGNYFPDPYGYQPPVEDRTEGQRAVVRSQGQSMYMEDYLRQGVPSGRPLGSDYNGQSYLRSPSQDADENRRRFGSQGAPRMTSNVREEDLLIAPTIDWAERSAEWGGQKHRT